MTNKEKFINYCKNADLIEMNGTILKYFPSTNQLCYRVCGEECFVDLEPLGDEDFFIENNWFCVKRLTARYKFRFYNITELV